MKVTRIRPVETFTIPQDSTGQAAITVRAVNALDMQTHENMLSNFKQSRIDTGERTEIVLHYNTGNTRRMFVELYLATAEINGIYDDDGVAIFKSTSNPRTGGMQVSNAMDYEEFIVALATLPMDIIETMHGFVLKVNPLWDPNAEKK